ncbi:MAG: hypothetical protein IPN34_14915 [Planctomycetes bacterium]|nr:hypothetical protein [Planctomycetota bacterium]
MPKFPKERFIYDAGDFPAKRAAKELLKYKYVVIDDITEGLVDVVRDELRDALPMRHDDISLETLRLDTGFGPVFIYSDEDYDVVDQAIEFVKMHRPGVRVPDKKP